MEHYDVIIVGAGLAGLQCARLLGERGLRVLLADRKKSLDTSIRVISNIRQPALLELACAGMRLPVLNWFAWHIFFGRGSFPDVNLQLASQIAM